MTKSLQNTRFKAHTSQEHRCFYCQAPTWLDAPDHFAASYHLSGGEARQLRATAEHLIARCDGGGNSSHNIVCACLACNSRRHRRKQPLEPEAYKVLVQQRLQKGRWHSPRIRQVILSPQKRGRHS